VVLQEDIVPQNDLPENLQVPPEDMPDSIKPQSFGKRLVAGIKQGAENIPEAVGMIGGGIVGAAAGPVGAVGGAALGAAGMHDIKTKIKDYLEGNQQKGFVDTAKGDLEAGKDAAEAEMTGQIGGKVLDVVPGAAGKAADWANQKRNVWTRRALGYRKGALNKYPGAIEEANDISGKMYDAGAIQSPLLHPVTSGIEGIQKRVADIKGKAGEAIARIRAMAQESGQSSFNPLEMRDAVKAQLDPLLLDSDKPILDKVLNDMLTNAKTTTPELSANSPFIPEQNVKDFDVNEGVKLVGQLQDKGAYPKGSVTLDTAAKEKELYRRAGGMTRDALDSSVENALGSDASKEYQAAKDMYGTASKAETAVTDKASSEAGNNVIGLRQSMGMAGAIAHGDPTLAVALAGGTAPVLARGQSMMAVGMNATSKVMGALNKTPQVFGKFAPILQKALQKSPQAFAVQHYILSQQDPEYQKVTQDIQDNPDAKDNGTTDKLGQFLKENGQKDTPANRKWATDNGYAK
jgi:hypothetical protein